MMLRNRPALRAPTTRTEYPTPANNGDPAPVARLVFPAANRAIAAPLRRGWLSFRALTFIIVVLAPLAMAAVYYLAIAADQYVAEFRLSLRTVDAPRVEPLLLLGSDAAHTTAASESQIVAQYIASRAIVDELDPALDLRKLFSPPAGDWWARLALPASIEELVRYWRNQVDPFYDTSTGTIIVRLRAFSPDDALRVAQAVVASSEKLVNELSARARGDAVGFAQTEAATPKHASKRPSPQSANFAIRPG